MAAATRDLSCPERAPLTGHAYGFPAKAGTRFFKHAIMGITAAKLAVPVGTVGCVAVIGLVELNVDNRDGADGDQTVEARRGIRKVPLPAATPADIGSLVYALDDQTLQLTNANGALRAGTLDCIDAEGVWVRF